MPNSDHKFDRSKDRQIVLLDAKQRIIDMMENHQDLPEVGVYDEPVRYFKANKEWCKIIFGWLDALEEVAGWPEAIDDNYPGIQGILIFEEGIELPPAEIDCGDVEDCLESSTIINNLNITIEELTTIVNEQAQIIEELQNDESTDGVDVPDNPSMPASADTLCRSANYLSVSLGSRLLAVWADANTMSLQEFAENVLGVLAWDHHKMTEFWQLALTLALPTLATDAQDYLENIKLALFCAELDRENTIGFINLDAGIPANEKAIWVSIIEMHTQAQLDELAYIGSLGTDSQDCSTGCTWIIVYDFGGHYTPVGDETLIITGDTWDTDFADFVPGNGYVSNGDQMYIYKTLPEQCRLSHYQVSVAKDPLMIAMDAFFYWRGSSGTGSPQYSAGIRTFSNVYTIMNFTVLGDPIMPSAAIVLDAFLGASPYMQRCEWIKIVGTGAYPQS